MPCSVKKKALTRLRRTKASLPTKLYHPSLGDDVHLPENKKPRVLI
jgi:hypothetical protein